MTAECLSVLPSHYRLGLILLIVNGIMLLFYTDCFPQTTVVTVAYFFKNTGGFQAYKENVALTAHLGLHCARCRNRLSWQLASPDPGKLAKDYSIRNQKFCNTEAAHCITRL